MDTFPRRWARRVVTHTVVVAAFAVTWALLPLWLLLALAVDATATGRSARARTVLFMAGLLAFEVAGLMMALSLWLVSGRFLGLSRGWFYRRNVGLQRWFTDSLFRWALVCYSMKLEVEPGTGEGDGGGLGCARTGPYLLFVRHASTADTVVPAAVLANPSRIELRYVLKRELLWDPCLDVVGNRLTNAFVDRSGIDSDTQARAVARLTDGLGDDQVVLIYPEGTRFTPQKRERALARLSLSAGDDVMAEAEKLERVLPPRKGGPFALIDAAPEVDVVFFAHSGLEGAVSLPKLVRAGLVGKTIRVKVWRVPARDIPRDPDARLLWLLAEWRKVDDFVAATCTDEPASDDPAAAA